MDKPRKEDVHSFTRKYVGIANNLQLNVMITPKEYVGEPNENFKFLGIWDTGASGTAISEKVVEKLNLPTVGMGIVHTAAGDVWQSIHVIDLFLLMGKNHEVIVPNLRVAKAQLTKPIDVLVGMDVISKGDFSVSNFNGRTCVSFRTPSQTEIDYVWEIDEKEIKKYSKVKDFDICPCGSQKKYKFCHKEKIQGLIAKHNKDK